MEYGILDFEGVETKREDPAKKQETQQRKYRQLLTRISLQAAAGTSRYKIIEVDKEIEEKIKPKLLGTPFFPRNAKTGRMRYSGTICRKWARNNSVCVAKSIKFCNL